MVGDGQRTGEEGAAYAEPQYVQSGCTGNFAGNLKRRAIQEDKDRANQPVEEQKIILRSFCDTVVPKLISDDDLRPGGRGDLRGDLELVDSETGEEVLVSASEAVLDQYERVAGGWADDVARRCRRLGAAYVRVMADDDLEQVLLQAWRHDGVLR